MDSFFLLLRLPPEMARNRRGDWHEKKEDKERQRKPALNLKRSGHFSQHHLAVTSAVCNVPLRVRPVLHFGNGGSGCGRVRFVECVSLFSFEWHQIS